MSYVERIRAVRYTAVGVEFAKESNLVVTGENTWRDLVTARENQYNMFTAGSLRI
jgi:hypothetical protein